MTSYGVTASGIAIEPVLDGSFHCTPDMILNPPDDVPPEWTTTGWFGPQGWSMPLGGFLLRLDGRNVLVDCGIGERHEPGIFDAGEFPESLSDKGVAPEDISDVILSHLHIDHVGWISKGGAPMFPNAVHHLHQLEWTELRDNPGDGIENDGLMELMKPVADLLHLVTGQRNEVLPDVVLRHAPGHTIGNCIVEVGSGEDRVLLLGDSVHHPLTLVEDGWLDNFDADPDLARRGRAELADELETGGLRAVGAHFDDFRFGRVIRQDGQRRWEPVGIAGQ